MSSSFGTTYEYLSKEWTEKCFQPLSYLQNNNIDRYYYCKNVKEQMESLRKRIEKGALIQAQSDKTTQNTMGGNTFHIIGHQGDVIGHQGNIENNSMNDERVKQLIELLEKEKAPIDVLSMIGDVVSFWRSKK